MKKLWGFGIMVAEKVTTSPHFVNNFVDKLALLLENSLKYPNILWKSVFGDC